ncbi:DUF2946 domain-containing protein [Paracidovorax anthurii]|uniref:DUF2946 family protein n=1 Tax=Paracidovorax anthurii TaxID=78229 RepID=A0A328ZIJ7_9BURK|nr:hypothetical protein [Paracidovorax anthurii]RAR82256.1 hypothetical protein AX018_101837 [Paracidovorax anthurii]
MKHAHRITPVLLLALWLNACLGWALHEAGHLRHALRPPAAASADAAPRGTAPAPQEDGDEGSADPHGLCAWCLAFAHLGNAAAPSLPALRVHAAAADPPAPATAARAGGRDGASPFSARGPPGALPA